MKYIRPRSSLGFAVATVLLSSLLAVFGQTDAAKKPEYKFVIVPKVVHPWFDQVNEGAKKAAKMIEDQTGAAIIITVLALCTPFGRYIYAIGNNREAAQMLGIRSIECASCAL